MQADIFENIAQVAQFLAAGWRGLRIEVENLSVLQAVVRKSCYATVLIEIYRDHALVDDLMGHEGGRALRFLRDVIEGIAIDGGDGGGGAKYDQDLFLRCADRNLFECAFRQHIPALQGFGRAAAAREGERGCKDSGKADGMLSTTHGFRPQDATASFRSCNGAGVDVTRRTARAPEPTR